MAHTQNDHGLRLKGSTMKKQTLGLALVLSVAGALALAGPGCSILPQVNRVQTNLIDKSVFEGDWWYTRTVIELDDDAAYAIGAAGSSAPWPGAMANFDIASQSGVIGRIRWVIDQNFIYAYRATEIIPGSNADAHDPNFRGSPLAVYRIQAHVDVRQEYNPNTGEATNVVSENTTDRRWYDRRFVRVDWSQNLVSFGEFGDSLEIDALFGTFRREPAPLGVRDPGATMQHAANGTTSLPAEWAPQIVRVSEDTNYRFHDEWPTDQQDTVHYMSFVTQEIWSPMQCFGAACGTTIAITTREAFLRVPPHHEYAVETLANSEYDRFGIIRTEQRTYLRGGLDRSQLAEHCRSNDECETGDCDMAQHICVGGLTDELGETDFLTYYRLRHNFYRNSFRHDPAGATIPCVSDWQCSGRFDDNGDGHFDGVPGSMCDQAAHVCTLPLGQRDLREVAYYLSPGYPRYLLRSAFELVGQWNEVFMRGARSIHTDTMTGQPRQPPSGMPITCQSANPTEYCFCGQPQGGQPAVISGEVDRTTMTCPFRVNWFQTYQQQVAAGVTDPYNCWIEGPQDVADSAIMAQGFEAYDQSWTGMHFAFDPTANGGHSECMLTLHVNSCDAHPPGMMGSTDPGAACEQLGDIRYNMFNYVSAAASGFCGVMQPMQDPVNGEAIVSPINMGGQCLDNFGVQPLEWWPILRGEMGTDNIISGDEVRRYFAALGTVHEPQGIAPGADPGFDPNSSSRPALPADLHSFYLDQLAQNMAGASQLHGAEGRAMLYSDRLGRASGTQLERRYAEALASEGFPTPNAIEQAAAVALDGPAVVPQHMNLDDQATMDRVSPMRSSFMQSAMADLNTERELMNHGSCMMMPRPALVYTSQFGEYWAHAFAGFDNSVARVRWAQAWHRAVMQHELGHGLGLEHNFAATLDRDNYLPGYYNIALADLHGPNGTGGPDGQPDLALPRLQDFDANHDQQITGDEQTAWLHAMQDIRHRRNAAGAGNYMTASTMDYPGDLSDIMGIGLYDRAAVYFNYFNEIEAYDDHCTGATCTTPTTSLPNSSADGILRSDQFSRHLIPWYRGGDHCSADSECPFSQVGAGNGQAIYQRCVTNPRYSTIPLPCGTAGSDATHCICSTIDSDFIDYVDGAAYRDRRDPQSYAPVTYLFCSNPRLNDISWCNTFDAGENFQEVIANWRAEWQSRYLTSYFRRNHRGFTTGPRTLRYVPDAAKIYQHLLFRLIYEPRFTTNTGPLGLDDQYAASIDVMNWFAELATTPDPGSYRHDATIGANGAYVQLGETSGMPGADLSLDPGQGYYHWSRYQDGELGFFRIERVGMFWDKLIALEALTLRDWGLSYTLDERYYINFFTFFPVEMTELFGGYILDNDDWFAPRVRPDGTVQYVNWYRAPDLYGRGCRSSTGVTVPCRQATAVEFPNPVIQGTSDDILRFFATAFALAEFPVFYDNSWERRLDVFALGSGDGFTIPATQRDGHQTCAYMNSVLTDPVNHIGGCTAPNADYITYTSDHLHTTYVAVKIRSRDTYNLEEEQLGFQFLLALNLNQDQVRTLTALETAGTITAAQQATLDRLRTRVTRDESFLGTLIELQRTIGINSYL
jgi:hypothetical protein